MNKTQSLAHPKWDGTSPVGWLPKYRRKKLCVAIRREVGPVLRALATHKESERLAGRLLIDPSHLLIALPPQYAVSHVIGSRKGKRAIHSARTFGGRQKNLTGEPFWARGYAVSTVGSDEQAIRQYIQHHEDEDRR